MVYRVFFLIGPPSEAVTTAVTAVNGRYNPLPPPAPIAGLRVGLEVGRTWASMVYGLAKLAPPAHVYCFLVVF